MGMDMSMLANMMPPGIQQLYDALQPPEVLQRVATYLHSGPPHRDEVWPSKEAREADCEGVAKFLDQLAQVLVSQGITEEAKQQSEPLRLECQVCHMTFGVDNAYQYRRRIEEGWLYACANGHPPQVVGTGRNGELMPDEQLTFENDPNVKVIYGDYTEGATDATGNASPEDAKASEDSP